MNLVFDLGRVVVTWRPDLVLQKTFASEAEQRLAAENTFNHPDWREMDRGTLDETRLAKRAAKRCGLPSDKLEAMLLAMPNSMGLMTETVTLMQQLKRQGHTLYCLSNIYAGTLASLQQRFDFWSLFTGAVFSYRIGLVKPEVEIFEHLLSQHKLMPAETIFIDDMEPNIREAARLGIGTILFRDASQCADELRQRGCLI